MKFYCIDRVVIGLDPSGINEVVANPNDPRLEDLPINTLLRIEADSLNLHITNWSYFRLVSGILSEMEETPNDPSRRRKLVIKGQLLLKLGLDGAKVIDKDHHLVDALIGYTEGLQVMDESATVRLTFRANQRVAHWLGRLCFLPPEHRLVETKPTEPRPQEDPEPSNAEYRVPGLSNELVEIILDTVDKLPLQNRVIEALRRSNLFYIWQVMELRERGLREPGKEHKRCVGPKAIREIKDALEEHAGLRLDTNFREQRETLLRLSEARLRQRAP